MFHPRAHRQYSETILVVTYPWCKEHPNTSTSESLGINMQSPVWKPAMPTNSYRMYKSRSSKHFQISQFLGVFLFQLLFVKVLQHRLPTEPSQHRLIVQLSAALLHNLAGWVTMGFGMLSVQDFFQQYSMTSESLYLPKQEFDGNVTRVLNLGTMLSIATYSNHHFEAYPFI